jgi:cytochrome c-type biogenesis protein CcmE
MKKSHIAILVGLAATVAIILTTASDASTYVTFDQAYQLASSGSRKEIHVVGELKKDQLGEIIGIEKSPDHLSFSFLLIDEDKKEQKVHFNEPMPADFLRSEKVVVIGHYQEDVFVAKKILLKCPSKYQEEKLNASL